MTLADLKFCRDYFRDTEHRDPSVTELRVIDTYWSDHCRHTTFLTRLEKIEIEKSALGKVIEDALSEYYATRRGLRQGYKENRFTYGYGSHRFEVTQEKGTHSRP